jgi:hypothetical protein
MWLATISVFQCRLPDCQVLPAARRVATLAVVGNAEERFGIDRASSRRSEAQALAEELLGDFEMHRLTAVDLARKSGRLARLLDDASATTWLAYESAGYPTPLDGDSVAAAARSNRVADQAQGTYWTASLAELEVSIESAKGVLAALAVPGPSGDWAYRVELDRAKSRATTLDVLRQHTVLVARIVGAIHAYVAARYRELRFGSAVETAFEVVRAEVDTRIGDLVPDALPMLSGAFQNAVSDNPEHWANAASTCRRLLKLVADALRPPGPNVERGGKPIRMGDGNYVNRLVDWIAHTATSETMAGMIVGDLEYLGRRLDAADAAGQKGAHDQVTRFDASRFITGTYLLLGDILRLG